MVQHFSHLERRETSCTWGSWTSRLPGRRRRWRAGTSAKRRSPPAGTPSRGGRRLPTTEVTSATAQNFWQAGAVTLTLALLADSCAPLVIRYRDSYFCNLSGCSWDHYKFHQTYPHTTQGGCLLWFLWRMHKLLSPPWAKAWSPTDSQQGCWEQ